MKKIFAIVGSLVLVGGVSAICLYNSVLEITVKSVDWEKKTVSIVVRGKNYQLSVNDEGLETVAPIAFSKYIITFTPTEPKQSNVWMMYISEGANAYEAKYFDFKLKQIFINK